MGGWVGGASDTGGEGQPRSRGLPVSVRRDHVCGGGRGRLSAYLPICLSAYLPATASQVSVSHQFADGRVAPGNSIAHSRRVGVGCSRCMLSNSRATAAVSLVSCVIVVAAPERGETGCPPSS